MNYSTILWSLFSLPFGIMFIWAYFSSENITISHIFMLMFGIALVISAIVFPLLDTLKGDNKNEI